MSPSRQVKHPRYVFAIAAVDFSPTYYLVNHFSSALATREWALLILFATFLAWAFWMPKTRSALVRVARAFGSPKIVGVLAIAAAYIAMLVYGLHTIGLWTVGDSAATLFWTLSSASISILNFRKAQIDPRYYRNTVFEVFSLTTLFMFLTDILAFSFWFWIIAIPLMTALHLLSAAAKLDPAHSAVSKLLDWVEIFLGLSLVYFVAREAIGSFDTLLTVETLRVFGLSAVLAVALLPVIAVLTVYEPYDRIFGILPLYIPDARLRRFAQLRAILAFRTDTDFLERWRRIVTTEPPTDFEEIKASFTKLRTIKQMEQNPQHVAEHDGWSPQSAIRFLEAEGLKTNDYHEAAYQHGEWWAASGLIGFGRGAIPDNVAYYVYGTAEIVSRLKLKMNVNNPMTDKASKERFAEHALILTGKALNEIWQAKLGPVLAEFAPFELVEDGVSLTLARDDWQGRIRGGYDLTFEIVRHSPR